DNHFALGTGEIRLDLHGFVERLGRSKLVDAGEERFRVLVDRLLDVAADLGGLADGVSNSGLDRSRHLLRTGVNVGSALLSGVGGLLDELTGSLGNFHVLEILDRVGDRRKGFLDGVKHGVGFGGHLGLSILGLSYGLTPSGFGPGQKSYGIVSGATQQTCCSAISRTRDHSTSWAGCPADRLTTGPPPAGQKPPIGPGTARYCAQARQYRAFCRRHRERGRGAVPRP